MVPTNNKLLLDTDGLLKKPVYADGETNTYRLFPRVKAQPKRMR